MLRSLAALVLFAAALLSWRAAGVTRDLADTHEQLATLDFAAVVAADSTSRLARVAALVDADAAVHAAIAQYWLSLALPADDERLLPLAANAAFRAGEREAAGKPLPPDRLDAVLQAYAAALKQHGFDRDMAYNYEFVARLRDRTGKPRPGPPLPPTTIHGREGVHPGPTRGEEFEILTPMDYGDREAQPEQTPGQKLPRKG